MNFQNITQNKRPFLIAGPCSAESENQLFETATQLVQWVSSIDFFRAGIWKPRTRPNQFEGVGEVGLRWLANIQNELSLPTTTEVATAKHVELCLKHNIKALWIGARTTTNPFSVQEIADALKGVDIPIFVKNPISPDLQLWIGAIERIYHAGISKIVAVHRGFSAYNQSTYRNAPLWSIPIELKRRYPSLEILCDPSHIAGNTQNLLAISQQAMDLAMNGLMIECHFAPNQALSDAQQQLTPFQLSELLKLLIIRTPDAPASIDEQLLQKRNKIDELDQQILVLLAERMQIALDIGNMKKNNHITILQMQRWNNVLNDRLCEAQKLHLNPDFVQKIFELIHDQAIQLQNFIMNQDHKIQK